MNSKSLKIGLIILPLLIFWGFNHDNIYLKFSLILGMVSIPYVVKTDGQQGGYRYAILATVFGIALLFFRSNSLYYFSTLMICFFLFEQYCGRLNHLPLFLVVVVSPIISNIVYIWSFPIRLKLTILAGYTLEWIGMSIQVNGNLIEMDGDAFSVDPACIGLKMVVTSLVLGIIMLAYFEKKYNREFSFSKIIFLLGTILFGAIVANFIRLLTLILFRIMPENFLHDIVGILCLGLYVLLPFYYLIRFESKRIFQGHSLKEVSFEKPINFPNLNFASLVVAILLMLQIYNGRQFLETPIEQIAQIENIQLDGFDATITSNGVLKLKNEEALIYIKPPVRFFQGSHDPRFCWQGSGYEFKKVQIENIAKKQIYTATLTKNEDTLYAAWWYENKKYQTPHEWDWRWRTAKGADDFFMINVNCNNRKDLLKWIENDAFINYDFINR